MKIKFRENECGDAHVLLSAYNENEESVSTLFNRVLPFENFRRERAMKRLSRKMKHLYDWHQI